VTWLLLLLLLVQKRRLYTASLRDPFCITMRYRDFSIFKIDIFNSRALSEHVCIIVPNFVDIGYTFAEIS